MKDRYDIVVAGAGCAGSVFAARMAARGFRVLLLDREREEAVGPAWRDLVERDAFEMSGVDRPVTPESCPPPQGIEVLASGSTTPVRVSAAPYAVVDRRLLAGRLIGWARSSGAEVVTQCIVGGAEVDRGYVVSVHTDRGAFPTRLAVDASGIDRVLCRNIPRGMGLSGMISTRDYYSLYRETRELRSAGGPAGGAGENTLRYHAGRFGGYRWLYPDDSAGLIDVGAAVQEFAGAPDPRDVARDFARANPAVGERVVRAGGGRVPARRPLDTMVAAGLMVIGDAACQALPVMCRGVGGAMVAAAIAADAAAFGLEARDVSPGGLWSYNYCYMRERGAHAAALDCIRIFMQGISVKDLGQLLARGVMDELDISSAMLGRFEMPGTHARIKSLLEGRGEFSLLVRFESALRHARRVFEHYMLYPDEYDRPAFNEWSRVADSLFDNALMLNERALLQAI